MLTKKKIQTTVLLLFGIIVLVNVITNRFSCRLDFTADQRYTLDEATQDILDQLVDPVTVTAYFSEDLPPDVLKVKRDFKDMLTEYAQASGGKIVYEFVNPNESQETEMKAQQQGISPLMINVRERDQMKQQRAYLGAVLQYGENKDIIPFVQPGSAMEYALSTTIKKISNQSKIKIGLLQGHGEPSLQAMQQAMQSLNVMYEVVPVTLSDTAGVPYGIKTLMVIAPNDTVPELHKQYLDSFLAEGGRMLVALDRVTAQLSSGQGQAQYTGMAEWLDKFGVSVEEDFVIDINCGSVYVRQQQGAFMMNTPVQFPYLPIIQTFRDHSITSGLEAVMMAFPSTINVIPKDTTITYTTLATTSERSGSQMAPVYFNAMRNWTENDFPIQNIPVAVALEGTLVSDTSETKMVVFSDGDFVVNGEGQQAQQLQPDNISILVNAVDWLSDDTGLIALRTKGVTSRPINPDLEDGTKTLLKYLNLLLPILLIIFYGVYRMRKRTNQRNKWSSENYA